VRYNESNYPVQELRWKKGGGGLRGVLAGHYGTLLAMDRCLFHIICLVWANITVFVTVRVQMLRVDDDITYFT